MAKTAKATAEKVSGKKSQPSLSSPEGVVGTVADKKAGDVSPVAKPPVEHQKQVQSVEFPEASGKGPAGSPNKLDILLDMSVPVAVSIGRTEIPVRQLLQLGPGSVLKLDKAIDEPADLYLKDAKFAAGDVVVVDGCFAVRIRQIIGADIED